MEECLKLYLSVKVVIEHRLGFIDTEEDTSWPRSSAWMGRSL